VDVKLDIRRDMEVEVENCVMGDSGFFSNKQYGTAVLVEVGGK
jgi:hypothetical protein